MAAFSHYLGREYTEAIQSSQRFLSVHPGNRDAPYAYYLISLCYYEQISDVTRDQKVTEQTRTALRSLGDTLTNAGSSLADVVQVHLYLRSLDGAAAAWQVFGELFPDGAAPARTTTTTDFVDAACLVQLDAVAVAH